MEKTYIGTRNPDGSARVIVAISADGRFYERELRHVVKHSPSGLEWGDGDGHGPSDLAHSILAEALERPEVSPAMYQQFKFDLVSGMPRDGFRLDYRVVMDWVNRRWSEMSHDMICGDLNVA